MCVELIAIHKMSSNITNQELEPVDRKKTTLLPQLLYTVEVISALIVIMQQT